jgi:blue copper oxidase
LAIYRRPMASRRQFAIAAGGMSLSVLVGGRHSIGRTVPFSTPLPIPRIIDTARPAHGIKLKAAVGQHAFVRGKPTRTYGYSAPVLGPVIRLHRGDEIEVEVENALNAETTVHWHGLLVPGASDGGPQRMIKPGDTWRSTLKIDQPATTAWYHPHPHHDTARQIYMGLAGLIIVDDGSDVGLGLPHTFGFDDLPLILQDRSIEPDGSIDYGIDAMDIIYGARGDVVVVNGAIAPFAKVPRGVVRLRLLNAANAQNFELRFNDQRQFYVIASDQGFLAKPAATTKLRISPAERFEILVDFANGSAVTLETGPDEMMGIFGRLSPDGSDDYVPVMRFEPTTSPGKIRGMPSRLPDLTPTDIAAAVHRRQFVINSGICAPRASMSGHADTSPVALTGINGRTFDMTRIDVETKRGTSEVWEIVSVGMAHPFHIHGASFRILSIDGGPVPPHLSGRKDVVLVPERAELLVTFTQPAPPQYPFMYHCHILEHEDAGLMGQYTCF